MKHYSGSELGLRSFQSPSWCHCCFQLGSEYAQQNDEIPRRGAFQHPPRTLRRPDSLLPTFPTTQKKKACDTLVHRGEVQLETAELG